MTVNITTNWAVKNGLIESPLIVNHDEIIDQHFDFEKVCLENCVEIAAENNSDAKEVDTENVSDDSQGKLTLSSSGQIKGFVIASEAKRVEVHASSGEYLTTAHGQLFDDFEGIKVYVTKVFLKTGRSDVIVSLPRSSSSCWIFCVEVSVSKSSKSAQLGTFDMSNVNSLLSSSNMPLSQNANNFKKIFENFQPNSCIAPKMCDMMSADASSNTSTIPKMSDILGNPLFLQSLLSAQAGTEAIMPEKCPQTRQAAETSPILPTEELSSLQSILQKYIDKKFQDLENNLMQRIDMLEKDQNKKLDLILERLSALS